MAGQWRRGQGRWRMNLLYFLLIWGGLVTFTIGEFVRHQQLFSSCPEDWVTPFVEKIAPLTTRLLVRYQKRHNITLTPWHLKSAWGQCGSPPGSRTLWITMENWDQSGNEPAISTRNEHTADPSIFVTLTHEREEDSDELSISKIGPKSKVVWVPYFQFSMLDRGDCCREEAILARPRLDAQAVYATKTRFCAWASRHCTDNMHSRPPGPDNYFRTHLFEEMAAVGMNVDALGNCKHNREPDPIPAGSPYSKSWDVNVAWYLPYKFSFAMENSAGPGYITEKIVSSYLANTIPIYWGAPDVASYLNPNAFIYCMPEDDHSFSACIKEIARLDADPEAWMAKFREPFFPDNRLPKWMRWGNLAHRLATVLLAEEKPH